MAATTLVDAGKEQDRDEAAERIERARRAREAAEKQVRERSKEQPGQGEWVTERAWRDD